MIYVGKVEKHTEIETNDSCANPQKNFKWGCSCGDSKDGIETYQQAESQLDSHMRQHYSKDRRRALIYEAQDEKVVNEIIAVQGAPPLLTRGMNVIGMKGMWEGKRGQILDLDEDDVPGAAKKQDRILIQFKDPLNVVAHAFVPLGDEDTCVREDPEDAIERPPNRDASHDVRHAVPSSQEKSEDALIELPVRINDTQTILYTPRSWRWRLFTNNELINLNQSLVGHGRTCSDHRLLLRETQEEMRRRNIPIAG